MAKGITIKITRPIQRRARRKDEWGLLIWAGDRSYRLDSLPRSPELAYIFGSEEEIVRTRIDFPSPGEVSRTAKLYQQAIAPKLIAMGVLRPGPGRFPALDPDDPVVFMEAFLPKIKAGRDIGKEFLEGMEQDYQERLLKAREEAFEPPETPIGGTVENGI